MDVFSMHRWAFLALGIDINSSLGESQRRLLSILQFSNVSFFMFAHSLFFLIGITKVEDVTADPLVPLIMFSGCMTGFTSFLKHLMFFRRRDEITQLLKELDGFLADTGSGKLTYWLMYLYEFMGMLFFIPTFIINCFDPDLAVKFPIWTPYEINTFSVRFLHFLGFYYSVGTTWACMIASDTIILKLSNQLCYRLQKLNNTLTLVGVPEGLGRIEVIRTEKVLELENYDDGPLLLGCIKEHMLLLRITDVLGRNLNEIFLYQSSNSVAVLLLLLYVFSSSKDLINDIIGYSGAMIVILLQVLMSCLSGELIKSQSENIHFSAYNNQWYNSSSKIKKNILIMSTYVSKEVNLKGAYVFDLSLQTYESFIKQVFSLFTVIRQALN